MYSGESFSSSSTVAPLVGFRGVCAAEGPDSRGTKLGSQDCIPLIARREACCPEDAVFSRTPNWVGRGFMVTILCVLTEDASYGFLLVAVVRVLVLLV